MFNVSFTDFSALSRTASDSSKMQTEKWVRTSVSFSPIISSWSLSSFSNCTFKKRFVAAGLGGRETVQVAYAPECMDTVWLYENGTYSAFDLVQKAYLSKSLAEIADAQQQEKVERTDWKKQELQAQLDLMSDIQAIADRSERTMPDRSNISKQIQRNRSTARKQESVSLMDLLAEQQEDDFDAR